MAFGFGFNKAKSLASAERSVKAGRLQNAIADYEKIVKEDPKDLTVLNTIGDLYARLGKADQATSYYKRVADAFASSGFTVKAIAMYKKITKLDGSSVDCLNRLAELYAAQGLHTDARSQYALVAEHYLKAAKLDDAARIFQKVLDLDPENAAMQAKLAELYVKLGKKSEARDIYLRNAELYRSRKNFTAADESLGQVLAIEKNFSQALLLRGLVKMELGDATGTIQCLEQVPDIDTRPEGLRSMLRAYFKLGNLDAAGPLARKLHTVFHETAGLIQYGEALVASDRTEDALALYTEFGDVLMSAQGESVTLALQGCIAKVKDKPTALEQLSGLLERAGATTHLAEIKELLAHASVQSGDLAKARDLYRELARLEPDNPLHTQNYRQVLAKLGEDPSTRTLTAEEAAQPVLAEELERTLPELPREYAPEVLEAVRAALTEAELFDSYNLPAKAISPLEAVLARAPQDGPLNQRLASLYARTSRFAEAAVRCQLLEQLYKKAGFGEQAKEYGELAAKYAERGGKPLAPALSVETQKAAIPASPKAETARAAAAFDLQLNAEPGEASGSVAEFEFAPPMPEPAFESHQAPAAFEWNFADADESAHHAAPAATVSEFTNAAPVPTSAVPTAPIPAVTAAPTPVPTTSAPAPATTEFDLSSEWEEMSETEEEPEVIEVFTEAATSESSAPLAETEPTPEPVAEIVSMPEAPAAEAADDLAELEIFDELPSLDKSAFTLEPEPAKSEQDEAVAPAASSDAHEFVFEQPSASADAAIFEMIGAKPESGYPAHTADLIEEIRFYVSQGMWDEAHRGLSALEREAPEAAHDLRAEIGTQKPAAASHTADAFASAHHDVIAELEAAPPAPEPTPVATPAASTEPIFLADPIPTAEELPELEPLEVSASGQSDALDSLFDLDSTLGSDFEFAAAAAPAEIQVPAAAAVAPPMYAPVAQIAAVQPQAMTAAAGSQNSSYSVAPPPPTAPAPVAAVAVAEPPSQTFSAPANVGTDTAFDFSDGALADIFAEFKHDMEQGSSDGEDPETHYNLGVAFKEMGLLDEAIGELQKVCQAIDQGQAFPQVLQAYTWLADCFVQKGVPEAAIRWYEKALRSPHVEGETATAIHYELACACEQAGNRGDALSHFMEVYGANIDYRDVADRIKALKA
jgi:tetratricopeptide (TPR) repeat protein